MIRVLLVDDEPGSLRLSKDILEESGDMAVDIATSPREALAMMARSRYDAIVSDYMMPEMDGLEFLKLVRAKDSSIPFILFTGREREEVAIDACNAGVSFFVQKGCDMDSQFAELRHKIGQAVARWAAEEELITKRLQAAMAFDLARIASWEYDPRTDRFRFDDIFYSLYGTDAEREGGYTMAPERYFREFIFPEDMERSLEFVKIGVDGLSPNKYVEIEHRIVRRDGEVRKLMVRVSRMVDADGNTLKVIGISQDITEE